MILFSLLNLFSEFGRCASFHLDKAVHEVVKVMIPDLLRDLNDLLVRIDQPIRGLIPPVIVQIILK